MTGRRGDDARDGHPVRRDRHRRHAAVLARLTTRLTRGAREACGDPGRPTRAQRPRPSHLERRWAWLRITFGYVRNRPVTAWMCRPSMPLWLLMYLARSASSGSERCIESSAFRSFTHASSSPTGLSLELAPRGRDTARVPALRLTAVAFMLVLVGCSTTTSGHGIEGPSSPATSLATSAVTSPGPSGSSAPRCAQPWVSQPGAPFCYVLPTGFADSSESTSYGDGWTYKTLISAA